jgi:hypothetical protein
MMVGSVHLPFRQKGRFCTARRAYWMRTDLTGRTAPTFITRTRGPFWSHRPARILLVAVLGTQTIATLIAVYGIFMTPIGWGWAGVVWGYALAWFLVNDWIKLAAYRIFHFGSGTQASSKGQPSASRQSEMA